jgi:hypothetical protein
MPRVSQLSATLTPSAAIGTATLRTRRPCSGSSWTNIVDITVPLPDWLAKRLTPDTR